MLNNLSLKIKLFTILGLVVLAVFIGVIIYLLLPAGPASPKKPKQTLSSDILFLTQPVMSFSGKVEKVTGNIVTVSQTFTLSETNNMMPPPLVNPIAAPSLIPTPVSKTIIYEFIVSGQTQLTRPEPMVNYLFNTITPPPAKLGIGNIKTGQYITLATKSDLRTLNANRVEAVSIQLPQRLNVLNGKIVRVSDSSLIIKAFSPQAMMPGQASYPAPVEKEYTVIINQDTVISRYGQVAYALTTKPEDMRLPPSEKLGVSDLKTDMQIAVWTAEDVTESKTLTALRLEPNMLPPTPSIQ